MKIVDFCNLETIASSQLFSSSEANHCALHKGRRNMLAQWRFGMSPQHIVPDWAEGGPSPECATESSTGKLRWGKSADPQQAFSPSGIESVAATAAGSSEVR
jgi:hypothetical protein